MPSSSPKQAKVMSAIAHGWHPTGLNIPVNVAKEFHAADAGHKYGAGNITARAMGGPMVGQPNMVPQNMPPAAGVMPTPPASPIMTQSPMGQTPMNAQAAGIAPPGMMPPPNPMAASAPGLNGIQQLSSGGVAEPSPKTFKGPIVSAVPGRTDNHFAHVPSGSYVIPADIVSGHGQGNSLAGMNALHKLFKMGHNPSAIPGASANAKGFAKGGADKHVGQPVEVRLAGGEVVVSPEHVLETMRRITKKPHLTLTQAHRDMDAWVLKHRKKLRKTLANLPGPARD